MTAPDLHYISLPIGVGVEPDPTAADSRFRLVVAGTADLHRIRGELDAALATAGELTAVASAARSDSEIVRRLAQLRPPFELVEAGNCPVPGCSTPGSHVHPPGALVTGADPTVVLDDGPPAAPGHAPDSTLSPPAQWTAASTADWSAGEWLHALGEVGVSQPRALRWIRHLATKRGEDPPASIPTGISRPQVREDLIKLARAEADMQDRKGQPW